jgi:hypothetical protein
MEYFTRSPFFEHSDHCKNTFHFKFVVQFGATLKKLLTFVFFTTYRTGTLLK